MNDIELWERYNKYLYYHSTLGLMIDISRMNLSTDHSYMMEPRNKTMKENKR